jgi:hypothetical protein
MNQILWNHILQFEFDQTPGKYGFSTRLAKENYWTKSFTEKAILEYKKFMYLAATEEAMVSPSEIVDTVWHQHLIFTQSYQEFCALLGKQVQHIPSTHHKPDLQKFRLAKARTVQLYEKAFGQQPNEIWNYQDMFDSLNLVKAKLKIRTIIILSILVFLILLLPSYYLLKPIYIHIDNPYFLIGGVG